ncbi:MAG: serine/threonine protein kinase, partial [Bacteroidaceae bacterium]|nr:serine/threonine protein kinase [Bacteroidaceae bacterium]
MQLKPNALLQGGKYRIERVLGQGGFGITYQAIQMGLNRKVAIKEFFMKEYCNRDSETSHVSVPSEGSKELVTRFRAKFVKEAQTIAEMENNHIIRIHDVFEENGTAYYVMEYLSGGDLHSRIPQHGMGADEALAYIRQVGEALEYIHSKNILHLDIKPTNIMFRHSGEAVLIDFGISKHYDEAGGGQTSSTPVGVSEGYAPTEQYDREGVSSFSAATDIYSLGATLYCLLNGSRPPKASIVLNEGLPELPATVPVAIRQAVEKAMAPRRKDRPQSVAEFMALLTGEEDETIIPIEPDPEPVPDLHPDPTPAPSPISPSSSWKKWAVPLAAGVMVALAVILWPKGGQDEKR